MSEYVQCISGIILTDESRRSAILPTIYPIEAGRGSKAVSNVRRRIKKKKSNFRFVQAF